MTHPLEAPSWKWPGKVSRAELHDGKVIVTWKDAAQADQAGVDAAVDEYAAHVASIKYREDRAGAYASTGDQLDAIWKQMAADKAAGKSLDAATDDALSAALKVKSDNPKPS